LKLVTLTDKGGAAEPKGNELPTHLAIANSHEQLAGSSATSAGPRVWSQTFGRVPGAVRRVQVRYAGDKGRKSTLVPIASLLGITACSERCLAVSSAVHGRGYSIAFCLR
jgi:hypothetical protein